MVTAITFLSIEKDQINPVAEKLACMEGISEVYSITGDYDLAVILRVKDNDALAELVTNKMLKVGGINKSQTHIAFRTFSKHDLEKMFSVGMEG